MWSKWLGVNEARYRSVAFAVLPQSTSTWEVLNSIEGLLGDHDNTYRDDPNDNPLWREG